MKIGIMKKGDKVLNVTDTMIVIQRKTGEVDLFPLMDIVNNLRVEPENIVTISFGDNVVSSKTNIAEIVTF